MPSKIFISLSAVIYIFINPYFEIGETHLFSPGWSGHARLHNAWQLISYAAFSLLALWLVWKKDSPRLGALIALIISGSFLIAYLLRDGFEGSMRYADGTQLDIFGFNPSVGSLVILAAGLVYCLISSPPTQNVGVPSSE